MSNTGNSNTANTPGGAVVPLQPTRNSLVQKFANKFSIEPGKLLGILKATAFKVKDGTVSDEQMAALLVVADQYGLNPFTKEIFAFPDKQNGIVPVVGVDGWSRIINDHPQSDGLEFRQSEEMTTPKDGQECPKWIEVVVHRKDRGHPIVVREYLDEVYKPLGMYPSGDKMKPGPWQTHTKRFLRHKALIQGARIAYGFSGIYDEDEAQRLMERDMGSAVVIDQSPPANAKAALDTFSNAGAPQQSAQQAADPVESSQREPVKAAEPPMDAGAQAFRDEFVTGGLDLPKMPHEAVEAWDKEGKFIPAWKWLSMTLPASTPEIAQALANRHEAIIRKVHGYNEKYAQSVADVLHASKATLAMGNGE